MENRLKERLTGAAILVALIVMLVPEMFHGQRGDIAASASSSAEGPPRRSYTIDLSNNPAAGAPLQSTPASAAKDDQPAAAPTPTPTPTPTPAPTPTSTPAPITAAAPPLPASTAPNMPAPAAAPATPAVAPARDAAAPVASRRAPVAADHGAVGGATGGASSGASSGANGGASGGGWAVQLGLFAKRDNAERLQHAAQAKGFAVTLSGADAKGLYRVYVGGMADRAAAESYAQRLKDQGMPAAVIASP